jgi:mycothiol system anti-sigma-R factor
MSSDPASSVNPFEFNACEETIHEIYHFLDGELTEEKRRVIETHLSQCQPCDSVKRFEVELRQVVADRCREEVPKDLRERIARLINHELDNASSADGAGPRREGNASAH